MSNTLLQTFKQLSRYRDSWDLCIFSYRNNLLEVFVREGFIVPIVGNFRFLIFKVCLQDSHTFCERRENNVWYSRYLNFYVFVKSTDFKICDVIIGIAR